MPPKKGSAGGKSKQEKGDDGSSGSGKEKKAGNAVKVIIWFKYKHSGATIQWFL